MLHRRPWRDKWRDIITSLVNKAEVEVEEKRGWRRLRRQRGETRPRGEEGVHIRRSIFVWCVWCVSSGCNV